VLDLTRQSLAGDVQSTLDRTDGSVEINAHLDQRLTSNVKCNQRIAVQRSQPAQSVVDVSSSLTGDCGCVRSFRRFNGRL
jgi:hypothetical protein